MELLGVPVYPESHQDSTQPPLLVALMNDSYQDVCIYSRTFPAAFARCSGTYYWTDFIALFIWLRFAGRPFRFLPTRLYFPANVSHISLPNASEIGMVSSLLLAYKLVLVLTSTRRPAGVLWASACELSLRSVRAQACAAAGSELRGAYE